MRDTQ
jgi:ubiquitin carboxyl-terminal hydrolase 47